MMAAWDLAAVADVAELVDALDLGSSAERRGGSSPFIRTSGDGASWGEIAESAAIPPLIAPRATELLRENDSDIARL